MRRWFVGADLVSTIVFELVYLVDLLETDNAVQVAENLNGPGFLRAMFYFCFTALNMFAASLYEVSS